MNVSLEAAASIEALVDGLRRQARETAQALDLERTRSRRLYNETVDLAAKVRRLEADNRRLVEQIDAAILPRSM